MLINIPKAGVGLCGGPLRFRAEPWVVGSAYLLIPTQKADSTSPLSARLATAFAALVAPTIPCARAAALPIIKIIAQKLGYPFQALVKT
ncbi:MAG: hypothetical protein LAT68_11315 [Cyclobacteriaceae bacterium]|nr:hypothetical protein [Cyclobacteriaceae bacterium]